MASSFLKLVGGNNNNNKQNNANKNPFGMASNPFRTAGTSVTSNDLFRNKDNAIRLDNNSVQSSDFLGARKTQIKKDNELLYAHYNNSTNNEVDTNKKRMIRKTITLPSAVSLQEIQKKHSICVDGEDIPPLLPTFDLMRQQYNIPAFITENLIATLPQGGFAFQEPTPIQMQSIPALMSKRDVIAHAPTGSGKTLSFALPMVGHIYNYARQQKYIESNPELATQHAKQQHESLDHKFGLNIHGIVLCPTRELALQTYRVYTKLLREREEYFGLPQHRAEREDIVNINATLLTKKWKTRCIRGYKERLTGKLDPKDGDDNDDENDSDEIKKMKANNAELDELRDDDDDDDGNNENHDISKKTSNKHYHILITTPLLLLSLFDRCDTIMKSVLKLTNPSLDLTQHELLPKILHICQMFVIDECDRLLDWGFLQQVNNILSFSQRVHQDLDYDDDINKDKKDEKKDEKAKKANKKQDAKKKITKTPTTAPTTSSILFKNKRRMIIALVSATVTPAVNILSQKMLTMPLKVTIGGENVAQLTIKQQLTYVMNESGKRLGIKQLINKGASLPMLIFVQSKERVMQLQQDLQYTFAHLGTTNTEAPIITNGKLSVNKDVHITRVGVLHSDLTEQERLATITKFRIGEIWILICTDVISRGLDFIHVKCVLNYDFPSSTTTYLHRIGRTGRAGLSGTAITYVTDDDKVLLPNIAQIVKQSEELQLQQRQEDKLYKKRQELLNQLAEQYHYDENGNIVTSHDLAHNAEYQGELEYITSLTTDDLLALDDADDGNPTSPATLDSHVAPWMLELKLASAKQQKELIYKTPIREDITFTGTKQHYENKRGMMNIFHRKREQAEKLGILSRNEAGTKLQDKLRKINPAKDDMNDDNCKNHKKRKQMSKGKNNNTTQEKDDIRHIDKRVKR